MKRKEERKKGNDLHTNVTHGKASCVKFQRDREKKKKEIIKVHIARFFFQRPAVCDCRNDPYVLEILADVRADKVAALPRRKRWKVAEVGSNKGGREGERE